MLGFLKQPSFLHSSLSPLRATSNSSIYRLLATATQPTSSASPTSDFAVQYLMKSCGLPSDKALRASRYLAHLRSSEKPDAVLRLLHEAGITEPHIRAAALRNPRFLCSSVEYLKPRMAQLKDVGLSPSHISLLFSLHPDAFTRADLPQRIKFWMSIFGSVEQLLIACRRNFFFLTKNPQTSAVPNLSFLQEQCSLSVCQIARLILLAPSLITSSPESLVTKVKRAEDLGVPRSSRMFIYALVIASGLNQGSIDAKILCLKSQGLTQEEVATMISKNPFLLKNSEKQLNCKAEFLIKQVGFHKSDLVRNPALFSLSLEKRVMPRSLVKNLLESKGLPGVNKSFVSFILISEMKFLQKFVLPHEHAIPGLHQAFADVCAGKVGGIEWFRSRLS